MLSSHKFTRRVEGDITSKMSIKSDIPESLTRDDILLRAFQFPSTSMDDIFHQLSNRRLHITVPGAEVFFPTSTDYVVTTVYVYGVELQFSLKLSAGFDDSTIICPNITCHKYHTLRPSKNNIRYYIVITVKNDLWGQSIVVRSPLQVTLFP